MNNVDRLFQANPEVPGFARAFGEYFESRLRKLDAEAIAATINAMLEARNKGQHIFFLGNGGSAATATHFANDVAIGTRSPEKPFRALCLADNAAITTAIANDDGFEQVFVQQLQVLMLPGDLVVAISASGNSPNLVRAVEYANQAGGRTIGIVGFDGGRLKQICTTVIHVPTERGEYGPAEAVHAYLVHLIGNYLTQVVRKNRDAKAA